ncbi:hypothetical protein UT300012_16570 [Paraclostridium bifermentans]
MNIDIVKPTPASIDTEKIDNQVEPLGFSVRPSIVAINANVIIPNGFPIDSPAIIPLIKVSLLEISIFKFRVIAVFAKANSGSINKLHNGLNLCSNLYEIGFFSFLSLVDGIDIAIKTPLIVA